MKRKILLLQSILLIIALTMGISACSGGHEHTFESAYSSNETHHWYSATCEHTTEVKDKEPHQFNQGETQSNGEILYTCQTCNYSYSHAHTFEETLTFDQTHHYYKSTCGHDVKKDYSSHDFDDGVLQTNGETLYTCQTCGYSGLHTHTYSEEYSYDEDRHWYASTCGCENEFKNRGYHVYGTGEKQPTGETIYTCKTCGYKKSIVHHEHTFEEDYSFDAEKHWFKATCAHKDQVKALEKHSFGDPEINNNGDTVYVCSVCKYETTRMQVRTKEANAKYVRTKNISDILDYRFLSEVDLFDTEWKTVKEDNVESYVIADGKITITISTMIKNVKHTKDITLELDETPISVEKIFTEKVGYDYMLNGIVVGFSTTVTENELILADKQTGKLISVTRIGEGSVLHGGYYLSDIQKGDEIIIPVSLVKENKPTSANNNKIYAKFNGGSFYETAIVSKNNPIYLLPETTTIENGEQLESFLSENNSSSNLYKTVKFKGKLNFVLSASYELFYFWFEGKDVISSNDLKINGIIPTFSNTAVYYTTGKSFNELVFGTTHSSSFDYQNPLSEEVEITAVYLGGNSSYSQFLILDQSLVK